MNECEEDENICGKGKCYNYYGSYHCFCGIGYKRDSLTSKCVGKQNSWIEIK